MNVMLWVGGTDDISGSAAASTLGVETLAAGGLQLGRLLPGLLAASGGRRHHVALDFFGHQLEGRLHVLALLGGGLEELEVEAVGEGLSESEWGGGVPCPLRR